MKFEVENIRIEVENMKVEVERKLKSNGNGSSKRI